MKKFTPFLTPFLVVVFGCLTTALLTMNNMNVSDIKSQVKLLDEKMFKHLTNDEIHVAKSDICQALQQQYDRICKEEELRHKALEERQNYGKRTF